MPTTREFLGDSLIKELEGAGFSPESINTFARNEYRQRKAAQEDKLRRLEYKADDMGLEGRAREALLRGEISEEEARNAQKFKEIGSIRHGWGLGGAKTVVGDVDAVERVSDFVNPFYEGQRDEKGNYVYQNAIEKGLRPKIKSAEKLRDDYEKVTGETAWGSRIMEGITQIAGDPINFVGGMGLLSKGSKLAQFGKKSLFFAGTGAASGGVMALGEGKNDEETLKNMGYGAAGGFVLGHAIDQGIQGIGKLIAKRRASRAANEADAVSQAENSDFLRATDDLGGSEIKATNGNRDAGGSRGGSTAGRRADEAVNTAQTDDIAQTMTAREFATGEAGLDEATAAKVVKEAAQGKEKSDFVDADTYADIVKFKDFENQRDYAKAYGEQIEAAKQSLNNAREQSAVRYADTQRAINEYQKQGMSASATRELINAKFKPSADEINYTRAYNGGADVDPRLAGQGIFYAIEKDIAAQAYTPEIYAARLKQRGFSDESAQAFTQAYVQKDINIAKDWANGKAAEVYENDVRTRVAAEIKAKNEIEGEGWTMRDGGEAKQYAEHKFEVEKWINDLSGVLSDEWAANLKTLALKHPEMFRSEADVFRVIKEIKDNPTHFFKNNRDDAALIAKELKDEKAGNIVIKKDDGRIVHVNKTRKSDIARLQRNNEKALEGTPTPSILDAEINPAQTRRFAATPNDEIISQKGNLVNEKEANGLRDSVSSVGDNASRAGGRQAGDEQILRQGRRDTTNASQTKRPAQSDGQMEQRLAAKADGEADAAAAGEQVVEKQGGGNNEVARRFTIDDAINAKLNFINENNLGKEGWLDKLNAVIKKYDLKEAETKNEFMGVMIRDRFKYGREFDFPSMKDVMPKISPLKPQYHEILNGAHKELNEILKNKTIPATREQNLKFHAANSNVHLGSGLVAGTLNSIDEDGNFSPERFAAGFLAGLVGGKAVATGLRKMTPKLYNKILGAAEKMPQMANGNPRLLGKLYSNGKDVSLNSFAGEKAITANVGKLDQAKAMLEKGADEVEIWQKTGWFKDEIDGKWKFEINPRGGELKPNPPSNTVLYNILNDEKLYETYPELQLYKVEVAGEYNPMALKVLGSADGGFIPSQKTFIINEKTTDFKSTLYHEIQHAIQEIEGFSPGASSKNGKYWLAGGEVEARNVQKRMNDVSYDGFKNSTSMEFFPYKEEAQLQRMAGDKEYMEYHKLSKKYSDYLNDKGDGLSAQEEARVMELFEKIKGRLGFAEDDYKKGYELYLKENAEYQKHPLYTLDAPRSERVNISRGDLNLSKELEKKYILKDGSINEAAIRKEAEPFIEKEYSLENFKAEFPNGKVDTPIGEVGIESRQFNKLKFKGRENFLGLIKPTLERPAFVVDFEDTTFFFKPFRDKDGVIKFASVIKERDGGLDVVSNYPMKNRKFELIAREGKVRYVQGSAAKSPIEHSLDDTVRSSGDIKSLEHSSDGNGIIQQNEEKVYHSRKIEEIKRTHPNVERELDESIAAMRKDSFNDSNFKDGLISKFDTKEITTQELGKSVNLSDKQLATLKNDIKNADFKVINESKIYFDKIGKDGDKKRFFVDIVEDGSLRVDGYSKKDIDSIPVKQSALEELSGTGDAARLKNMSFEVKAAYRNELDPIKKEAILKTAELNKLKKAAQSGDKAAAAKFEEFKAKNLDENGNIKDGLSLC